MPNRRRSPAACWRSTFAVMGGVSLGTRPDDAGEGVGMVRWKTRRPSTLDRVRKGIQLFPLCAIGTDLPLTRLDSPARMPSNGKIFATLRELEQTNGVAEHCGLK